MPARRAEQRENQQDMTKTDEHRPSIISKYDSGRKIFAHRHTIGMHDWVDKFRKI
jgi:predicted transcriptional regulator